MADLEKTSLLRILQWFPATSSTTSPILPHASHIGDIWKCMDSYLVTTGTGAENYYWHLMFGGQGC